MDLLNDDFLSYKKLEELLGNVRPSVQFDQDEWTPLLSKYGDNLYARILSMLTQMELDPPDARICWFEILDHQAKLSQILDRDIDVRVAVCDYFTRIRPKFKNMVLVEASHLVQKERAALIDDLTGLYNRRFFNQVLQKEVAHSKRSALPFSLFMIDVDHFKEFNDLFGHKAGDRALVKLAQLLILNSRAIDYISRYGGDEFALILPQADKAEALMAAERHRQAVEKHRFEGEDQLISNSFTVSMGVATFPTDAQDGLEIFQCADEALFRCKESRNQVQGWLPDKRHCTRYPLSAKLMYRPRDISDDHYVVGKTGNVSLSGLLCMVDYPVDIGKSLDVILDPGEDKASLRIHARVARLVRIPDVESGWYLGLYFEPNNEEEITAIQMLVDDLSMTKH